MARLPMPGGDSNNWGTVLNDFLAQAHATDGTLKPNSITSAQLATGAVAATAIADNAITAAKLDSSTQTALSRASSAVLSVNTKLPNGAGSVTLTPTDIGAPTAIAQLSDVNATGASDQQVLSYNGGTGKWSAATVGSTVVTDASTTSKGIIQLGGDLSGSNDPTNPTLGTGVVTDVKVAAGANIAQSKILNLTTNLAAKAPLASPTFTGTVTVPTPTNATDATTKTYVDSAVTGATIPDATTLVKGKLQLAGDLAGTAALPTVDKLKGVTVPGTAPSTGQVLTATGAAAASWQTPATAPVSSVAGRTGAVTLAKADVGLTNVDNTSDVNKPVSTATQTAINLKAPLVNPTFTGVVTIPEPTNGSDATTKTYVDATVSSGTADASTSTKGKLQLAGDLAGTASLPVVDRVKGVSISATAPTTGYVLTATGTTAASWQAPSGGGAVSSVAGRTGAVVLAKADVGLTNVDNTADTAKPVSTAAQTALNLKAPLASPTFTGVVTVPTPVNATDAATKTYVDTTASAGTADATTTTKGKLQLAGDLAGTAALPTVDKLKGVTVPVTAPSTGQVLTATSSSAATWQTPTTSPVTSVAGKTGAVTLVKADVGLGNVDNISDVNKPVSTATQTALNLKSDLASSQVIVRYDTTTSSWPARPAGADWGVLFLSTNSVSASTPNDVSLIAGDRWLRHPNAS